MALQNLDVRGIRFNVRQQGTGSPVLLVHGFPLDLTMWNAQIEALSQRYHVIAPDLRGFGASESMSSDVYSMEQFADDLADLLDTLEVTEQVTFCGLSMGGYIAWQFWRKHRARLKKLILCDTRAAANTPQGAETRRKMANHVLRSGTGEIAALMLPNLLADSTRKKNQGIVEKLTTVIRNTDPRAIAAAQHGMAQRDDFSDELADIDIQTLLLVGEQDTLTTSGEMQGIANCMPRAHMVTLPNAGHMSPMENPQVANQAILDFLK